MSYQPPLIGSRQILNFTAHSWPGAGGWIAILAALTAIAASGVEIRNGRRPATGPGAPPEIEPGPDPAPEPPAEASAKGVGAATVALLVTTLLSGCAEPAPRALVAGVDGCADCLMVIDASGYGAEIVTRTGKVLTFDSSECMTSHLAGLDPADVHSLWVVDFSNPEALVPAESAFYLVSPTLGSPMGLGITAFGRAQDRDGAVNAFGGDPMDWDGIRTLVAQAWPDGRPPMPHGGHASEMSPPDGHAGTTAASSGHAGG